MSEENNGFNANEFDSQQGEPPILSGDQANNPQPQLYPPYQPETAPFGQENAQNNAAYAQGSQNQLYPPYQPETAPFGQEAAQNNATYAQGSQNQLYPPYNPNPTYYSQSSSYMPASDPRADSAALLSMIMGILSLVLFCFGPIFGIIAIVKSSQAKKFGYVGSQATAGMVCGIIGTVSGALMLVSFFLPLIFSFIFTMGV